MCLEKECWVGCKLCLAYFGDCRFGLVIVIILSRVAF